MHAEGERRNQSDPRPEGTYLVRRHALGDLLHHETSFTKGSIVVSTSA